MFEITDNQCLGAFALTSKASVDQRAYREILTNTLFGTPNYGEISVLRWARPKL
jgi:hypothetical protein